MDFAAWNDVRLYGGWRSFVPRNDAPRIGRILVARGRDAADAPLTLTFGPNALVGFTVWSEPPHDRGAPRPRRLPALGRLDRRALYGPLRGL